MLSNTELPESGRRPEGGAQPFPTPTGIDLYKSTYFSEPVFHALSDALLGAAGLGDIGCFFPDTDIRYKNLDSSIILSDVMIKLKNLSYHIVNIDLTIVLEKPKLQLIIPQIKESISNYLKIKINNINIKATTSEGMGFVGKGHGIACYSVVLIEKV